MNHSFPVKDLLRRPLQTSLTIIILTLSIASTFFLLQINNRISFSVLSTQGTLTLGLSAIFTQFSQFVSILVFIVGIILTSFIIFLMMTQRTPDFGLIKASGCPNSLVAGYFITELLTVILVSCFLGLVFGLLGDYITAIFIFHTYTTPNYWFAALIFIVFFTSALFFGLKPISTAAKMAPIKALSSTIYYGLTREKRHKPLSRSGITWKISIRSLIRRQSSTVRIVILLSGVFILLTVSISGSIIANNTTREWLKEFVHPETLLVAHTSTGEHYKQLISAFYGEHYGDKFNFSDKTMCIPKVVNEQISQIQGISKIDPRLIVKETVREVSNFTIDPETGATFSVGGKRSHEAIIIGVDPSNLNGISIKGQNLKNSSILDAVIGDSISNTMYIINPKQKINLSDPLLQSIRIQNTTFEIVGICVDQINNGFTTYVPIRKLQNITGISGPNVLLLTLDKNFDKVHIIEEIRNKIQLIDSDLNVYAIDHLINRNIKLLDSIWSAIMTIPLLTLVSASLSLLGYTILTIEEQHKEFGILRAIGTRSKLIIQIISIQTIIILLSSLGFGISLGIIPTLMVLMANPIVTTVTIIEIIIWLLSALVVMLLLSLYPAFKLAKKPVLNLLT